MDNLLIKRCASKLRRWAKVHVGSIKKPHDFNAKSLDCMCAYASTVLLAYLHKMGVTSAVLVTNQYHCFVMVEDFVVDVTATQFSTKFKAVEFCLLKTLQKKDPYQCGYWEVDKVFKTVAQAFKYLDPHKKTGFPITQYFASSSEMTRVIADAFSYLGVADD